MSGFERFLVWLYTCSVGGGVQEPESKAARSFATRLAVVIVMFSGAAFVGAAVFAVAALASETTAMFTLVFVTIAFALGFGSYADRVFDRHRSVILEKAIEIRADPQRGRFWALRRTIGVLTASMAVLAILAIGFRALLIALGLAEGPMFKF